MKYFQYQCNMTKTDYGAYIRSKYGLSGYALWCILLETVASPIDKRDRSQCYRILHLKEWKRILGINPKRLILFLEDISRLKVFTHEHEELNLIQYEIIEKNKENSKNLLKISIPILEDWCDNHTRNSSPKEKNLQVTNKQELESESELKLKLENNNLIELKLNEAVNNEKNLELEQEIVQIYDFYKVLFDRPKYQLTKKRRKKLQARLVEPAIGIITWADSRFLELLVAITELSLTDFNMGKNNQQKTYIELDDHCCNDQEQVEQRLNQALERNNLEKIERYLKKEGYLNEEITS